MADSGPGSTPASDPAEQSNGQPEALATDPELAALIHAWPTLPEPIKAGILAMVRVAGKH